MKKNESAENVDEKCELNENNENEINFAINDKKDENETINK
jgi:hypothetical protein